LKNHLDEQGCGAQKCFCPRRTFQKNKINIKEFLTLKKYLLLIGFVVFSSYLSAMEDGGGEDALHKGDGSPRTRLSTQASKIDPGKINTGKIDTERAITDFMNNPATFGRKGGFCGLGGVEAIKEGSVEKLISAQVAAYNMLLEQNASLLAQLELAKSVFVDANATQRALKEAQEAADKQKEETLALQEELRMQASEFEAKEAAYDAVIEEKISWLREADKYKLEQAQSKEREKQLIEQTEGLKKTIHDLLQTKSELEKAKVQLIAFQKALEKEKLKGEEANGQKCKHLEEAIKKKDQEVSHKDQENERLLREKEESERLIANLKKAQTGSDHYTQLLTMIRDKSVSDHDLTVRLMSVANFLNVDLDKLSEGHEVGLATAILDVTCPRGPRPLSAARKYEGCWRLIGNDLLEGTSEFVWEGGNSVNTSQYKFEGSRLKNKLAEAAASSIRSLKVK
jgi:hypothetical protein